MDEKKKLLSKDFSSKVKQLRINKGWSQREFAQKIGADHNRVSKYERGAMYPTLEMIVRIAEIFDVSTDYLLRNKKNSSLGKASDQELLNLLEQVNELSKEDRQALISVIDAFITRHMVGELSKR